MEVIKTINERTFTFKKLRQHRVLHENGDTRVVEVSEMSVSSVRKAVKIYSGFTGRDSKDFFSRVSEEIVIMSRLRHPNIIRLEEAIYSKCENTLSLITALYAQGTLADVLKRRTLDIDTKWRIFIGIGGALKYLHSKFTTHGDIKPPNIFVSGSGRAVLADFDCARSLREQKEVHTEEGKSIKIVAKKKVHNWVGTRNFRGPEYVRGVPVDPFLMDAYALGITMYIMYFDNLSPEKFYPEGHSKKILSASAYPDKKSYHLLLAINRLVRRDPMMRRSIHRVLREVQLPEMKALIARQ